MTYLGPSRLPLRRSWLAQRNPTPPPRNAVDDSFFLACTRADSIASYNNRVVMRDNTIVIAVYLICMPDNTYMDSSRFASANVG